MTYCPGYRHFPDFPEPSKLALPAGDHVLSYEWACGVMCFSFKPEQSLINGISFILSVMWSEGLQRTLGCCRASSVQCGWQRGFQRRRFWPTKEGMFSWVKGCFQSTAGTLSSCQRGQCREEAEPRPGQCGKMKALLRTSGRTCYRKRTFCQHSGSLDWEAERQRHVTWRLDCRQVS